MTHALSHGAGGGRAGHRGQVFRLGPTVYLSCKVARAPARRGGRGLGASPPPPAPLPAAALSPRPSSPEWAAGVPLPPPATAPPRSAWARSLHQHQKTHRGFNARKRNASCFPIVSSVHPPHQNKPPFPSRSGGHPRSQPRSRTQCTRWEPAAPRTVRRRRAGSRALALGGRQATPRDPSSASRSSCGGRVRDAALAAGLREQSCRKPGRGGAPARATQSGGCARGARGPRTKAPGRARLAVRAAVPEPRDCPAFGWPGARERTPRGAEGTSPELQPLFFPLSRSSPRPLTDLSGSPKRKRGGGVERGARGAAPG